MIYGRWGQVVTLVRRGTLDDVRNLDKRKPDKQDREAMKYLSYVVVLDKDTDGKPIERLYHLAFLRADDGSKEISKELARLDALNPVMA